MTHRSRHKVHKPLAFKRAYWKKSWRECKVDEGQEGPRVNSDEPQEDNEPGFSRRCGNCIARACELPCGNDSIAFRRSAQTPYWIKTQDNMKNAESGEHKVWFGQFTDFLQAEEIEPPADVSFQIFRRVRQDLGRTRAFKGLLFGLLAGLITFILSYFTF